MMLRKHLLLVSNALQSSRLLGEVPLVPLRRSLALPVCCLRFLLPGLQLLLTPLRECQQRT
jgi:hypothetical protein